MPRLRSLAWALVLALALTATPALAQDAFVLSQEREGTATVYVSADSKLAMIVDGGKKGGLTSPRIEGQSTLQYLRGRNVEELVLVCSHPHDDHAAGLREIIKNDPLIREFKQIRFVESGYPFEESLYSLFRAQHPDFPADRLMSHSARNANALAEAVRGQGITASNFVYDPGAATTPHGNAIISHITLSDGTSSRVIVDFDDADSKLVKRWADWAKLDPATRRPDIVLMPHHCSDLTDVSPLLDKSIRPKEGIATANGRNGYLHPGPKNMRRWTDTLGVGNVRVTGDSGTIRITPTGVAADSGPTTPESLVSRVFNPQLSMVENELFQLEDAGLKRELTPKETKKIETLRRRQSDVVAMIRHLEGDAPPPISMPRSRPPSLPPPSASKPSTEALAGAYRRVQDEARRSIPPAGGPMTPHTAPPRPGPGISLPAISRGRSRGVRFTRGFSLRPVWGGVVIGNGSEDDSDRVVSARFTGSGASPQLEITVERDGGKLVGVLEGFTPTEIWSAYNFVQPSLQLKQSYTLTADDTGLVGMTENKDAEWTFAVHPAIAGTLIARDAMRLDMGIAMSDLKSLKSPLPDFSTYQWYDERSTVRVEDGEIVLRAATDPHGILLRVRLWADSEPPYLRSKTALQGEIRRRFRAAHGHDPNPLDPSDQAKFNDVLTAMTKDAEAWMTNHPGQSVSWNSAELVSVFDQRFDAFRRIERFARLVAVLNWVVDSTDRPLPPLPQTVVPVRANILPRMKKSDVLGTVD